MPVLIAPGSLAKKQPRSHIRMLHLLCDSFQVSVLERSGQLSAREAARAKELTVRKDKQLMDLQSKTREQEARWAELEKRLHRRSVQTAQEGYHLAAEAQNARASHETAAQQAAARLATAEARLTDAERVIAQLREKLQSTSDAICAIRAPRSARSSLSPHALRSHGRSGGGASPGGGAGGHPSGGAVRGMHAAPGEAGRGTGAERLLP
jgi:hypothetical protein